MKQYGKWREILCGKGMLALYVALFWLFAGHTLQGADSDVLRIMPLGDSITAGYTDNPQWQHPFHFGYRSGLYSLLKNAGYNFQYVGGSPEPWDGKWRVPTNQPTIDLRSLQMDHHRGYGGVNIARIQKHIVQWMKEDRPHMILLMIGINGINAGSSKQLDSLVHTIFETDKNVKLIVAQITPLSRFNQDLLDYNTYIRQTLVPSYAGKGQAISTVDLYQHFLTNPKDPKSIDERRLSNGINHPTNLLYDKMAESWFQGIELLLKDKKNLGGEKNASEKK